MHTGQLRQRSPCAVECCRHAPHVGITSLRQQALLERRRKNAHTQRLAQNQRIAWLRGTVFLEMLRIDQPDDNQAINRFGHVNRVPARQGNARFGAH